MEPTFIIDIAAISALGDTGNASSNGGILSGNETQVQDQAHESLHDEEDSPFRRFFGDPDGYYHFDSEERDEDGSEEDSHDGGSEEDINVSGSEEDNNDEEHSEDQEEPLQEFVFGNEGPRKAFHPEANGKCKVKLVDEKTFSGFYSVVWCINTAHHDQRFDQLQIQVNFHKAFGEEMILESSWWSVAECTPIHNRQEVRLKLNARLHVQERFSLESRLSMKLLKKDNLQSTGTNVAGDSATDATKQSPETAARGLVGYFELVPYIQDDPSCTLIPLDPKIKMPLILVPPSLQGSEGGRIMAMDVSVDQKYVVTLFTNVCDTLTVHLWDLTSVKAEIPIASVPIDTMADGIKSLWFGVCLSSNGDCIAVFQRPNPSQSTVSSFSPRFFKCINIFSITENGQQSPPVSRKKLVKLEELESKSASSLSTFVGDAKFQHLESGNILPKDSQEHVLVTCSSHFLDVFDVSRDFQLLYTILLPSYSFGSVWSDSPFSLIATLRDEIFAWRNEYGEISIWNWRTAKCVEYIPSSDFHIIATSPDGSTLVGVTSEGITSIYSLASGLLLGTKDCRILNAENIVLSFDQIMVFGKDLDSGWDGVRAMDLPNMAKVPFAFDMVFGSSLFCILDQPQDTAVKRAIFFGDNTIDFVDVRTSSGGDTVLSCGPDCKGRWIQDDKIDHSCFDKELDCTYKLILDTQRSVLQLRREGASIHGKGQVLVDFPSCQAEDRKMFFLPSDKRFLVTQGQAMELWALPTAEQPNCRFLAVVTMGNGIWTRDICHHGSLRWKNWYRGSDHYFNASRPSFLNTEDTLSLIRSIPSQVKQFSSFSATYKEALVELMLQHINKNVEDDQSKEAGYVNEERSIMWALISNTDVGAGAGSFLCTILESPSFNCWIPQAYEFSANPDQDMIAYLIWGYKISTAKILINYCLARARSNGLVFLDMLLISIPHIIPRHPEVALEISRRVAFFPVRDREAVLHHSISNGIQWRWNSWKPEQSNLYQLMDQNPVFHLLNQLSMKNGQLESERLKGLPALGGMACEWNGDIPAKVFVAPFSLLWAIQSDGRPASVLKTNPVQAATWVHWLIKFMRLVYPRDKVHVQTHYSDLDSFDNPAITALMTYKWTRFVRYFWGIRLFFQMAYEFLVLSATFFQLYGDQDQEANLLGGYVAIIVVGFILLLLEMQQMRGGIGFYFSSPYNYVDLSAYTIPVISSCALIANPESVHALRALSFSVVIIYIHIIFELRVFKNVCKVVTIVVNILLEIPTFVAILCIFILSFAHSINHLTEVNFRAADCQPDPDNVTTPSICNAQRSEFPRNYLQSVSATYFFMTGNYGPVATLLTDGHWTSQLMVAVFFFFTAVLMMNVIIALMNGVYSDAIIAAERAWARNRPELIASAENLTYSLPYFRDRYDYFPKYVYYLATEEQVKDYQQKYALDKNPLQFDFTSKEYNSNTTAAVVTRPSSATGIIGGSSSSTSISAVTVSEREYETSSAAAAVGGIEKMDEIQSMVLEMKAKLNEVQDQLAHEATKHKVQMGLHMAEMEERIAKEREASQIQIQQMIDAVVDRLVAQLQQR